jgi:hypothetical protein
MCCPKTDIAGYIQVFGGGVFPLWFCQDHLSVGNEISVKMDKELVPITTKKNFKIGDRTFKKYSSAKW